MRSANDVLEQLSQRGFRLTRARQAIVQVLAEAEGCLTPAEIFERARTLSSSVGLVTAYRTLDLLSQLGYVRKIHADDGCHGYALISDGHWHHLTCQRCGRVVQFEGCDLSELWERVRRETGFSVGQHMLELAGLCPDCQSALEDEPSEGDR